jgi:imidazolonepropionase-like amidohydrolase
VLRQDNINLYRELAGGTTTLNILHGSANTIGGQNAVVKLRYGLPVDSLIFEGAPPGIKFALGENVRRTNSSGIPGRERRYPFTRMGVEALLRDAFTRAQEYQQEWKTYETARANTRRGQPAPIPPKRDLQLDALVEVLEGTRLVHAHSYRADEILQLIRLADEMGFEIRTFQHVLEGYKVADEIAAHGAGASTFSDWWAYKVEAYDAIPHNAALMTERGVLVSINSDDAEEMRHLNQEAAKTMKWGGLSEEEALKLVTLNPAIQLGVEDRLGSIEVGKDADLAVFRGHPLTIEGAVQQTYVDGKLYFDRDLDRERQRALEQEKEALLRKHLSPPATRPTTNTSSRTGGEEVAR